MCPPIDDLPPPPAQANSSIDDLPPPPAPAKDPESGHIFGLDTGVRVSHKDIQDLSTKYGVDAPTLEAQAVRLGATYPDATAGEKAMAKVYSTGDTMLGNIPTKIANWSVGRQAGDNYSQAMDELKDKIQSSKTLGQKATDVVGGLSTPLAGASEALLPLEGAAKYAGAIRTGAAVGGAYGLGNSKDGEGLKDTVNSASAGGIAAPAFQFGTEKALEGLGKTLGKPTDIVKQYLNDKYLRGRVNDSNLNFDSMQSRLDDAANARLGAEASAQSGVDSAKDSGATALRDARDTAAAADERARAARGRYGEQLQQQAQVPGYVPDLVHNALTKQRDTTRQLAQQQMEMLSGVPGKLSLAPIEQRLAGDLSNSQVDGISMPGDKDASAIEALKRLLDPLRPNHVPTEVPVGAGNSFHWEVPTPAPEASPAGVARLRQVADDNLHDVFSSPDGAHTDRAARAALGFRSGLNEILDTQLPNSEDYQALRGALAHESGLATDASKTFGGPNKFPKLQNIFDPNSRNDLALLQELDSRNKGGIMDALRPTEDAQKLLGNPELRGRAEAWLPEVEEAQKAAENLATTKQAGDSAVDAAKEAQSALLDKHDPYSKITPGDGSQNALRKILFSKANKPELQTQNALEQLGQDYAGSDLLGDAKGLRAKEALGGGGPQGSRLVNMGRGVGRALAGNVGEAVGGVAGGALDFSTGKAVKTAMDAYLAGKDPMTRALAQQIAPKVDRLLQSNDPKAKAMVQALDSAAQRGPEALAVTHAMLQKDPTYSGESVP